MVHIDRDRVTIQIGVEVRNSPDRSHGLQLRDAVIAFLGRLPWHMLSRLAYAVG